MPQHFPYMTWPLPLLPWASALFTLWLFPNYPSLTH